MFRRFFSSLVVAILAVLAVTMISIAQPLRHLESFAQPQPTVRYFPETQHSVRGIFLQYWNTHGGLTQQGYPLTEEFSETNKLDGKTYTVQYFERAIFEHHPENKGTQYEVLLSQLGKFELDQRYPNGSNPAASPVSAPTVTPIPPTATAIPTVVPPPPIPGTFANRFCKSVRNSLGGDTYMCMSSEAGDYVGQGRNWIMTSAETKFVGRLDHDAGVTIHMDNTTSWSANFGPAESQQLTTGIYENASRWPFNESKPGLDISGDGRGCNRLSGRFEVLEIAYDYVGGQLQRFAANFEQRCEGMRPLLAGAIRYHSNVAP